MLLASGANVYGNAEVPVLDESCAVQPENDYAVSKCAAMELLSRHWRDDLPIVVSRPFNYTGVGQSPFSFTQACRSLRPPVATGGLGNIDVYRDFPM